MKIYIYIIINKKKKILFEVKFMVATLRLVYKDNNNITIKIIY